MFSGYPKKPFIQDSQEGRQVGRREVVRDMALLHIQNKTLGILRKTSGPTLLARPSHKATDGPAHLVYRAIQLVGARLASPEKAATSNFPTKTNALRMAPFSHEPDPEFTPLPIAIEGRRPMCLLRYEVRSTHQISLNVLYPRRLTVTR